jgi:hypothetical protein
MKIDVKIEFLLIEGDGILARNLSNSCSSLTPFFDFVIVVWLKRRLRPRMRRPSPNIFYLEDE